MGESGTIRSLLKGELDSAVPSRATGRFSCPKCAEQYYHRSSLITHLKKTHLIEVGK